MSVPTVSVLLSTCPPDDAWRRGRWLVEESLAASVNVIPQLTSFYRWDGEIQESDESLLVIKCRSDRVEKLTLALQDRHPYKVPSIIGLEVAAGNPDYLRWVHETSD